MYTRSVSGAAFALCLLLAPLAGVAAQVPGSAGGGAEATPAEIAGWNIDVEPDGAGLPDGSGTPSEGAGLYASTCAMCHGSEGQGVPVPGRAGYPRLVGGIGSLASEHPIKTVGSYWPFATIVFDYIRRAMPLTHPQSLTADQVYALTAFLLWKNGIIAKDAVMNAKTLPVVAMPNAHGFYTRPAPETNNVPVVAISPFQPGAKGH